MSWLHESRLSWMEKLCVRILKPGKIPRHVAFIMDGNRRYARKKSLETIHGHMKGFHKLTEILEWCTILGIIEVTVYAFSTENFKRCTEEVEGLMEFTREKFSRLLKEIDRINERRLCIRILGELSLLPEDIQQKISEIMLATKDNDQFYLNICMAYTSREEICNAVRHLAEGVESDFLLPSDISEELLDQCMYYADVPPPDILVRTSGEVRLSDFLLWQTSYSILHFLPSLWPEFSIWHLFYAVLMYQCYYPDLKVIKERHRTECLCTEEAQTMQYIEMEYKRKSGIPSSNNVKLPPSEIQKYKEEQKGRIQKFLSYLHDKQNLMLKQMKALANETISNGN